HPARAHPRAQCQDVGQDLHGLAETHVVRQASAETRLAEETQPAEPFALVGTQLADEARRRVLGLRLASTAEARAHALELGIHVDVVAGGEQRVEQERAAPREAQLARGLLAAREQRAPALEPGLRQDAEAAVPEADDARVFLQRLQDRR